MATIAPPSARATVRRLAERARYDTDTLYEILDEALVCHLGFACGDTPFVIPTTHARSGQMLYVHGSPASRTLRLAKEGAEVCVTVTLLDGLVLARSWMHHSVNYRSAAVFGKARPVEDPETKLAALRALVEHVVPGRAAAARPPSAKELAATLVLALPLSEASVKVRTGPPLDDEADYSLRVWAGVVPLRLAPGAPIADTGMAAGSAVPDHVRDWRRPTG